MTIEKLMPELAVIKAVMRETVAKKYTADEAIERGWIKPAGGAERYWEARWRDEKAENEKLRAVLLCVQKHYATMGEVLSVLKDEP